MPKLYIANIPFDATEDDLRAHFETVGTVASVNVVKDKETGNPRGFGFVQMGSEKENSEAMIQLQGTEMGNPPRRIRIEEANERPRQDSGRRDGDRRGNGYGDRRR